MPQTQKVETLQSFLIENEFFDRRLYHKVWSDTERFSAALAKNDSGLQLLKGNIARFDTLLNSFFERYWVDATNVRNVQFYLKASGKASVTLRRVTSSCGVLDLGAFNTAGPETESTIDVSLEFPSRQQLGRLFVEILSYSDDFVIHEAAWRTTSAPTSDVKIDVVICTFNNPGDTIRNVTNLLQAAQLYPQIHQIFVVDQGTKRVRQAEGFAALTQVSGFDERVRVFEQENFGGTGGFTRGMMEAVAAGGASHLLLLDDDIVIDARLLERAISMYRHATAPFILGGHMMDLFRPNRLAAMSEIFDYRWGGCYSISPPDLDCVEPHNLDAFLEPAMPSYNAWWFCCFPVEFVKKYGLPLPFFIRTDDAEFGTRMVEGGERVLQLPGLMVWHKPFHAKPAAWMVYYSLRNDLILCSLRRPYKRDLEARLDRFMRDSIYSFQYDQAMATCLALEDFVRGPQEVFTGLRRRHKHILAEINALAPQLGKLSKHVFIDARPVERFHPKMPAWMRGFLNWWWNFVIEPKPLTAEEVAQARVLLPEHQSWPWVYGDRVVKVLLPATNEISVRFKNRALAWRLRRRYLRARAAWRRDAVRLREAYLHAAPEFTSWESWRTVLAEETETSNAVASLPEDQSKSVAGSNRQPPLPLPPQSRDWSPAAHPEMGE